MTSTKIRNKGKYIEGFPSDFTVIDIETTGLSSENNEIIELSAVKVRNDKIIGKFSELIKPDGTINAYITNLTGITNEMTKKARPIEKVLQDYIDFVSNDIILGHNVNFDINFIYDNLVKHHKREFNNDFIDTMKISRKHLSLKSNSLKSLAKHFCVDITGHHRALNDCMITLNVYSKIKKENACPVREQTFS